MSVNRPNQLVGSYTRCNRQPGQQSWGRQSASQWGRQSASQWGRQNASQWGPVIPSGSGLETKAKYVPERSCFACGRRAPKRDLIRLVCVSAGNVEVDEGGGKAGRGTYLCKDPQCWKQGFNKTRLDVVLRCSVSREARERLLAYSIEVLQPSMEQGTL